MGIAVPTKWRVLLHSFPKQVEQRPAAKATPLVVKPTLGIEDPSPEFQKAYEETLRAFASKFNGPINPRETMRRLPWYLQRFLTWLTGKPLSGQRLLWHPPALYILATGLVRLFGGVSASILIMHLSPVFWPFLIISWMVTVSGARQLLVHINHNLVHGNFSPNIRLSRSLGDAISTLLLVQNFDAYREDHVSVHHSKLLATPKDIDMQFLLALGFGPGQKPSAYWNRLLKTIISPGFHVMFLRARLAANFLTPGVPRRLFALAFYSIEFAGIVATGAWVPFLVAWVFPLIFLYHVSALLQFACEHRWLRVPDPGALAKIMLARLTTGRFMGEAAPEGDLPSGRRMMAWIKWWIRMLFIHLPVRVFIMTGDLPAHDWHHRHPHSKDWGIPFYARQADIETGTPGWEPYTEVWGFKKALDAVFLGLSQVPPFPDASTSLTSSDIEQALTDM